MPCNLDVNLALVNLSPREIIATIALPLVEVMFTWYSERRERLAGIANVGPNAPASPCIRIRSSAMSVCTRVCARLSASTEPSFILT